MGAFLLRVVRILLYLSLTLPLMVVQALAIRFHPPASQKLPSFYHRTCCRIMGFRLEVLGNPSERRPTLFVGNHVSYLDITVFGAVVPGSFVAKAEVRSWPLFGWLARLQKTVFVDRQVRSTQQQRDAIADRLSEGGSLILFPEGTSGDGNRVLPFKSSLFSVAAFEDQSGPLTVQPVSITYVKLDGMPMGRGFRPFFAWYGDMEMAPHLWTVLGLGSATICVEFHAPVTLTQFGSRKALAQHCEKVIAEGVSVALSGRRTARSELLPNSPVETTEQAAAMRETAPLS